jgi:hypothetical protein
MMNAVTATTFEVSDVVRAGRPLPEAPYKQAVGAMLTPGFTDWYRWLEEVDLPGGPSASPPTLPLEACSRPHGRLLAGVPFHPVVAAAHRSFIGHRPLRLSPDAIWLLICQAVASHVNAHAEELRPRLVHHEGQVQIHVRRDDFLKGSPENPWDEVLDEFSASVRDHVGPSIDLFLPAFSTTGPAERAAAEVVLLEAVRSYFRYSTGTLCGIPAITLEGTAGDWETLARRVEEFSGFGLEGWLEVLRPILRQFVRASDGDVDGPFWRSLYKYEDQSGCPGITGWVLAFFPYLKDPRTGAASFPVPWYFERDRGPLERALYPDDEEELTGTVYSPGISSFPVGLSSVPFRWDYLGRSFDMEFLGGFVGVAQDEGTLALRPEIGWAVREAGKTD